MLNDPRLHLLQFAGIYFLVNICLAIRLFLSISIISIYFYSGVFRREAGKEGAVNLKGHSATMRQTHIGVLVAGHQFDDKHL